VQTVAAVNLDEEFGERLQQASAMLAQSQAEALQASLAAAKGAARARGAKATAKLRYAQMLARSGAHGQAGAIFREIIKLKRDSKQAILGRALIGLGNVQIVAGKVVEAVKSYRAAMAAGARSPELHANLGLAHLLRGERKQALVAFKESARRGGRGALRSLASGGSKSSTTKPSNAPSVDSSDLRSILDAVLLATPERTNETSVDTLPLGGRRGSRSTELSAASLVQW